MNTYQLTDKQVATLIALLEEYLYQGGSIPGISYDVVESAYYTLGDQIASQKECNE